MFYLVNYLVVVSSLKKSKGENLRALEVAAAWGQVAPGWPYSVLTFSEGTRMWAAS